MAFTRTLLVKIVVGAAVCLLAGAIGGLATGAGVKTWYPTLIKPWFTPPGWLFGPVWTALYLLMGVAVGLVWHKSTGINLALVLFAAQLVLNILWSFFFFYLHAPALALVDILLLEIAVFIALVLFWRIVALAGILLLPYLIWVSFATVLNASIVWLNR